MKIQVTTLALLTALSNLFPYFISLAHSKSGKVADRLNKPSQHNIIVTQHNIIVREQYIIAREHNTIVREHNIIVFPHIIYHCKLLTCSNSNNSLKMQLN